MKKLKDFIFRPIEFRNDQIVKWLLQVFVPVFLKYIHIKRKWNKNGAGSKSY